MDLITELIYGYKCQNLVSKCCMIFMITEVSIIHVLLWGLVLHGRIWYGNSLK